MNLLAGSTGFLGNDILKELGNIESQTIALSRRAIPVSYTHLTLPTKRIV